MIKYPRRRIVPIAIWRRLMSRLSKTAILAGNVRGLSVDAYRRSRGGLGQESFDLVMRQQVDEIVHTLRALGEQAGLSVALIRLQRGLDPTLQTRPTGPRAEAERAMHTRAVGAEALRLGARLRELAELAEVVALGLELRAEDHDAAQQLADCLDAIRPSRV
jgi:hypothetical protein